MIAVATPPPPVALFDDWTPAGDAPGQQTIEVYSNCQAVEAFLNDRSLGRLPINGDASPRRWSVRFEPGSVRAVCADAGVGGVEDRLDTAGPAAAIVLTPDRDSVGSDFDDLVYVRARVVDAAGVTVPGSSHRLRFTVRGAGTLVATDNASSTDHTPFASPEREALNGTAVALVRGAGGGPVIIEARSEGLEAASTTIVAMPQ